MLFRSRDAKFKKLKGFKVETEAHVGFSFGSKGSGTLSMDWMNKGPEVRQVTFTADGDTYAVDIVKNIFSKNGEVRMQGLNSSLSSEYRGVYRDFARHLAQGKSLISTKELAFIQEAYRQCRFFKLGTK